MIILQSNRIFMYLMSTAIIFTVGNDVDQMFGPNYSSRRVTFPASYWGTKIVLNYVVVWLSADVPALEFDVRSARVSRR